MKKIINHIMLENTPKLKEALNKIAPCMEFIFSMIAIYAFYRIIVNKYYHEPILAKHIILFIPACILTLYLIIFMIKNSKEKIEKIVVSFLIPISLCYVFFMIPTHVPDENAHLWKAYEISTGKLITKIEEDGSANSTIPQFFTNYSVEGVGKYAALEQAKAVKTDYADTTEVDNPARNYPTLLYIFSSIGLLMARILQCNGIFAIYLARLLNTIVFLIASYYSIKLIPFGKKILVVVVFLPMMLQQCCSISADCIINCTSIFYIAYSLYLYAKDKKITKIEMLIFTIISIVISISKITYFPLVGICLIFISTKKISKKTKTIGIPIILALSAIMAVGYYFFMQQYPAAKTAQQYAEKNYVNQKEQIQNVIQNPRILISVLGNSLTNDMYFREMIGEKLGWLNINISSMYITLFLILLVIAPFLEENKSFLKKWHKIWFFLIFLASYWLVFLALYLGWTPVGSKVVAGVQGRYFLPIIPLLLLSLCKKESYIKWKNSNVMLPIILSGLNVLVINEVFKFFI